MNRLVLGCGSVGALLGTRLADRPGRLLIVGDDTDRIKTLRDDGFDAQAADLTDPDAIRAVGGPVDSIIVTPDTPGRTANRTAVARDAYPNAFVLAYTGSGDRQSIAAHADRVIDPTAETVANLLGRIDGSGGARPKQLAAVLRSIDGPLGVIAHSNPDPDAIASAVGLCRIADALGVDSEACYYGEISHQENRALVNVLEFDLRRLTGDDHDEYGGIALVDHSRPGANNGLPETVSVDVVIDHHPPRGPVEGRFVDLRSDVGATSTLIAEYIEAIGMEVDSGLATGLLYGIRTDTMDFSREVSIEDFTAASTLIERADHTALRQIETPSVTGETLDVLAAAAGNRRVEKGVLTTFVGALPDRDALAQAADRLLDIEDVTIVLVFGREGDTIHISARARGAEIDLGEVLRDAFGQIGSAGGHADMAGAQLPVRPLLEGEDGSAIADVIGERFRETITTARRPYRGHYDSIFEADIGYPRE
ncbi:MAG: DHHA1 domain-containing protein [Natronomonas sp.]